MCQTMGPLTDCAPLAPTKTEPDAVGVDSYVSLCPYHQICQKTKRIHFWAINYFGSSKGMSCLIMLSSQKILSVGPLISPYKSWVFIRVYRSGHTDKSFLRRVTRRRYCF
ncbi:hypothetical protein RB195_019084 [Necator americanus]|uniref:Uncharacterized protein n=1 Tax=Necator americanus TaxID=51031 RepID=A0ABR1CEK2_NECAM